MSRQSKNVKTAARALAVTTMHKNGEKGPAKTAPKHNKKWTYRGNPDAMKRLQEIMNGPADLAKTEKTSGKRILRGAGAASQPSL